MSAAVQWCCGACSEKAEEGDEPTLFEMKTPRLQRAFNFWPEIPHQGRSGRAQRKRSHHALLHTIKQNGFATDEEIAAIDTRIGALIGRNSKIAEESPWSDDGEVLKDVYVDQDYPFITD